MRARRSCLSVPASEPRFLERADKSAADQIFLDLEDSVAPSMKERARTMVVEALQRFEYRDKVRCVRVNAVDTKWCYGDITAVVEGAGERIDCLVIPKVEGADHVHFIAHLLNQVEMKQGFDRKVGLELQIETARGLDRISEIAAASERNEALIFGPGDFSASMRLPTLSIGSLRPDYPGDFWHYFMSRIVVAARAHGLQAIDGPYVAIKDLDGYRTFAERAAMLGYDGKWALHPSQIDVVNEVFAPKQADFDRAFAIIEAYRKATDVDDKGAVMLGEEMIDEASRKMAAVMYERGLAAGMKPSPD
jgi:citrate lyase subunit beta/citryl-CoA lyase